MKDVSCRTGQCAWHVPTHAHLQHAVQAGVAASADSAKFLPGPKHQPAPLLVHRIPRHPPQHKETLHGLWPQQVVRILQPSHKPSSARGHYCF